MNRYHNIIYKYNMIFKDEQLSTDLKNCNNLPSKWTNWCIDKAKEQWMRRLAWMKNIVYPWNNKNWDYKQFVINKYHPEDVLGLKKGGSITALIQNIGILIEQVNGLLINPNPDADSIAGISDQPRSNNVFKNRFLELKKQLSILSKEPEKNRYQIEALYLAINEIISAKLITSKEYGLGLTQDGTFQKPPYDDPFFQKSLTGEASSSYFIQSGFCNSTETNKQECINKKFNWIGDACFKPKYMYINNSPGLKIGRVKGMKGLIPSIINDVSQLNPDSIVGIMQGYSVPGVDIQQCANENFDNYNKGLILPNPKINNRSYHNPKTNNRSYHNTKANNRSYHNPKANNRSYHNPKANIHIPAKKYYNEYNNIEKVSNHPSLSYYIESPNNISNLNENIQFAPKNWFTIFTIFTIFIILIALVFFLFKK
jgi:hypothetical protein